jgi:putative spermidine/putrescine transport system substrate-binding protein
LVVDPIWAATALDLDAVEPIAEDAVERPAFAPIPVAAGSVPAYTYAMVAAFRRDAVLRNDPPRDWVAWWDSDRYAGRRALPRQALVTFELALLADGVAADQLYPLDQARAIESLTRVSAQIEDRWWQDGLEPVAWLARDRTDFAAAWHYRVVAGQRDGRDVDFVWDQGLLVADHWVIPKGARNQDIALDLMRFATSPEVQAELARTIPLGPVTPAAFDLLNTAEARLLPTAPESVERLVLLDARWWAEHQTEADEQFSTWLLEVAPDE